jgi:hypothetical protein
VSYPEGPEYYGEAARRNMPFAKPSKTNYQTPLNSQQESAFRSWVKTSGAPFDPSATIQDYDMRGYWAETGGRGWTRGSHFPDTYKTPYDTTFSNQSKYANPNTPFEWHGDTLIDKRSGNPVSYPSQQAAGGIGPATAASAGTAGTLTAGARIWKGGQPTLMGDGGIPYPLDPSMVQPRGIDFLDQDKMVANILASYWRTEGTWMRPAGEQWYPAAREWTKEILRLSGSDMDLDRATAIVAQLSENTDWPQNMQRFMNYLAGRPVGTTQSGLGRVKGIAEADDPLSAVRGPKINNFVRSILGRFDDAVAVDRWAARIALGTGDKELAQKILGRAGAYESMADAYRTAAGQVGISPSEMQAVTWVEGGPTAESTKPDATIQTFKETGEWRFPITREEIGRLAYQAINEKGGITIDLSGHEPSSGYAFAPSKKTELPFEPGKITRADVQRYMVDHFTELKRPGNKLGIWVDDDGTTYLDVSQVGKPSPETIAAAQKAKQLAVWDIGAPPEHGNVDIGTIDAAGKYHPIASPEDLFIAQRDKLAMAARPQGKPPKGKVGPGSAMEHEPATLRGTLGRIGRVAGPMLTVAGDAFTAYGLVAQAAGQGQQQQIAQGHVIAQGPSTLGIPTGTAFSDPTLPGSPTHEGSTFGRSPADVNYWLKHGRWPAPADVTIGPGNGGAGDDQLDHFAIGREHGLAVGKHIKDQVNKSAGNFLPSLLDHIQNGGVQP